MPVHGVLKADTLYVADIAVDFKGGNTKITATAAFVISSLQATAGWTKGDGSMWSEKTRALLQELRTSMEEDFARLHFLDAVVPGSHVPQVAFNGGGLAEHLSQDAEQV